MFVGFVAMALRFLHLFAGKEDRLGAALVAEAKKQGIDVTVEAYDLERDSTHNLLDPKLVTTLKTKALEGWFHGGHSGFPCTTFSLLRWRSDPNYPGPVRSRKHIYGLPSNDRKQQEEADRGTLGAILSVEILKLVEDAEKKDGIPRPVTMENPPETSHPEAASAFALPEVDRWVSRSGVEFADFNTCCYADPAFDEPLFWKPQRFVGKLKGLSSLYDQCRCPTDFVHPKVVGKENSSKSAAYPRRLCHFYAQLVVGTWVKSRAKIPRSLDTCPPKMPAEALPPRGVPVADAEWSGGTGKHGMLRETISKKMLRDAENKAAIGGLRRPVWSLERAPGVRDVGRGVSDLFDTFTKQCPGAQKAAELYGTPTFQLNFVDEWKLTLRSHFKLPEVKTKTVTLKGPLDYTTPVDTDLLEAWVAKAGDPDPVVVDWLRSGAPLGANLEIPCAGIFPARDEDKDSAREAEAAVRSWAEMGNYASFRDSPVDAAAEMSRLESKGFVKKLTLDQVKSSFGDPVLSKLALIVKEKEDGTKKRRVIVDALRSGANGRAKCPERIILPRCEDIHRALLDMKSVEPDLRRWYQSSSTDWSEWGAELVSADLTDAFTHFPVAWEELGQCVSPAGDGIHAYVFIALFFGHKSAPLVMCRFAALLTRLIQGLYWHAELSLATYVDDRLMLLVGSRPRRLRNLSLCLLTLAALGVQMSWSKGARGTALTWIGVHFGLNWREGCLYTEVPEKLKAEILEKLTAWENAGMVALAELRSFAGKLTWAAGIYRRAKWAVSMVHGAIAGHEADLKDGTEASRRARRVDNRPKDHLVPVRRFEVARQWLKSLFQQEHLRTKKSLWQLPVTLMVVTDASPQGCGGMLLIRPHERATWSILEAYEYPIGPEDADLLGFELWSHRSQAYLEALAILMALRTWAGVLCGIHVALAIRSDSTVALALLEKASSSSPALNVLAGEITLMLEKLRVLEAIPSHIPGKLNILADYLSRPQSRGEQLPGPLKGAKIRTPPKLTASSFALPLACKAAHDADVAVAAAWAAIKG